MISDIKGGMLAKCIRKQDPDMSAFSKKVREFIVKRFYNVELHIRKDLNEIDANATNYLNFKNESVVYVSEESHLNFCN